MAGAQVPAWYDRYRELRNRTDSGRALTPAEQSELDDLESQLVGGAADGGRALVDARRESGKGSAAEAVPDLIKARTSAPELRPNPDLDAFFNDAPPAEKKPADGGVYGFAPSPPPPPPPPPLDLFMGGESGDKGGGKPPAGGPAWAQGVTSAFDRPQAVVVMGPNPLPVKIVGGPPAGGNEQKPTGGGDEQKPTGGGLLDALSQASAGRNQSGSNLSRLSQQVRNSARQAGGAIKQLFTKKGKSNLAKGAKGSTAGRAKTLAKAAGGVRAGAAAGSAGAAASGVAGGAVAGSVGGPVGAAIGAVGAAVGLEGLAASAAGAAGPLGVLAVSAVEAGKAVYAFARAQEAEIRKLAEVGPQQAAAVARLDAERVGRDVKTAAETGGSSEMLAEALSKLEDALQPIESLLTNLANVAGTALTSLLADLIKTSEPMVKALNGLLQFFTKTQAAQDQTTFDWIKGLDEADWKRRQPMYPGK